MKRRVFTILSALSLVLCLATCVVWVRSYRALDDIDFDARGRSIEIRTLSGMFIVQWISNRPYHVSGWFIEAAEVQPNL